MKEATKRILEEEGLTLVLTNGKTVIKSSKRGVRPLLDLYENGDNVCDFFACDKVVGKGAGVLYALLKVRSVYALTISKSALDFLIECGIEVAYDNLVERILNRDKSGFCPIESAVIDVDSAEEGIEKIYSALEKLKK